MIVIKFHWPNECDKATNNINFSLAYECELEFIAIQIQYHIKNEESGNPE